MKTITYQGSTYTPERFWMLIDALTGAGVEVTITAKGDRLSVFLAWQSGFRSGRVLKHVAKGEIDGPYRTPFNVVAAAIEKMDVWEMPIERGES